MIKFEINIGRQQRKDILQQLADAQKMSCDHEKKFITNETVEKHMSQFESINDRVWGRRICNTAGFIPEQ